MQMKMSSAKWRPFCPGGDEWKMIDLKTTSSRKCLFASYVNCMYANCATSYFPISPTCTTSGHHMTLLKYKLTPKQDVISLDSQYKMEIFDCFITIMEYCVMARICNHSWLYEWRAYCNVGIDSVLPICTIASRWLISCVHNINKKLRKQSVSILQRDIGLLPKCLSGV